MSAFLKDWLSEKKMGEHVCKRHSIDDVVRHVRPENAVNCDISQLSDES